MEKLKQLNSVEHIYEYIDNKFEIEKNVVEEIINAKKYKLLDKVFYISGVRDFKLQKNKYAIEKWENEKIKIKNDILFKLNDFQISEIEYDTQISQLDSKEYITLNSKISKIQNKNKSIEHKWNTLIEKYRNYNKIKISKLENYMNNKVEKILSHKEKIKNQIKISEIDIQNLDSNVFINKNNKINDSKFMKELSKLEDNYTSKSIGPLTYEKNKIILEEKIDLNIIKLNDIEKNSTLKKYSAKVDRGIMFGQKNKSLILEKTKKTASDAKLIFVILVMAIIVGFMNDVFFTTNNIRNILTSNVDLGCMAIGMAIIILSGGIDLSIGSVFAFAIAVGAKLIVGGTNPYIAMLVIVLITAICGMVSGLLVSYGNLQPFIVTLVLMLVFRGATYVFLHSNIITTDNQVLNDIGTKSLIGIPISVLVFIVLAVFCFIILRLTKYGRSIYAIGGNYKAALLSGIKNKIVLTSIYIFAGVCLGIGSILYLSRVGSATPTTGASWELNAIAAVVLGGTSLIGGKGGIAKTVIGWLVLSILQNALVIIGLDPNIQYIVKGCVILLAILSDNNYGITRWIKSKSFNYYLIIRTI